MARRDDQGRHERKRGAPSIGDRDQDQEQDGAELEQPKPEHARLQDQLGNAAIAAMLGGAALAGGIGIEVEHEHAAKRVEPEKSTPELGGDDDPVDADGPLVVEDVSHAWQPRTKRQEDRPAFTEPMPDDVLPPEDARFLATLPSLAVPQELPVAEQLDSLVQPSVDAVRLGLRDWAVAALRWGPDTPAWRVLALLVERGLPVIQDPHGRVGIARSRMAAIGVCAVLAGPALTRSPSPANAALVDFALELEGRAHRVRTVAAIQQNEAPNKLPRARDLFLARMPLASGRVVPATPSEAAVAALRDVLRGLLGLTDPMDLVPSLVVTPDTDDADDPLGLDAVLAEATGGARDPEAGAMDLVVASAERLAGACAATRVRAAGVALAIAETALEWSHGTPSEVLDQHLVELDRQIAENLHLLVEVARAAQRRQVGLEGLRNGLRRGARALRRIQRRLIADLIDVIGGIVPRDSLDGIATPEPPEALAEAFGVGEPERARPWASSLPDARDRRTCEALVDLAASADTTRAMFALPPLVEAWRADDPHLARALAVLAGAATLNAGHPDKAHHIARSLRDDGRARRNGALLAEGALLGMEAHLAADDLPSADDLRHRAGASLWRMGARGPLSLLARWRLPEDEDATAKEEEEDPW